MKSLSYSIHLALCFLIIFLSACVSSCKRSDSAHEPSTGTMSFSLEWGLPSRASGVRERSPSGNVCVDYGIETISAYVYNNSNINVASEEWPCSAGEGTISDVPPGRDICIMIEGGVSGEVHWRGEIKGISVYEGKNTNVGTVMMMYIGGKTTPPNITSKSPSDMVVNVPISTTITATFNEDVVAASVNTSTFTVRDSSSNIVPGTVTYDSNTLTATFTPASPLSSLTFYTVTITSGVQNKAGIPMAGYTWNFTTAPIPPQNIVTFPGDGSVTILWDEVPGATWYTIYMADFLGVSKTHYNQKQTVDTPYYKFEGLTNEKTYYFVVTSGNNVGESDASQEVVSTPNAQANYYVFPDIGIDTLSKQVAIIGEAFQETPTVALYGGGPYITGTCDTPGSANGVFISGTYAYVADGGSGLQVIDIGNPFSPRLVGSCDTPRYATGVTISGDYAYVADGLAGLQVIEKFKPLEDITYLDSFIIKATIPAGYRPGTYDLHITNPDGEHTILHNAFTVYHLP